MLLRVLRRTGQSPLQRGIQPLMSVVHGENPAPARGHPVTRAGALRTARALCSPHARILTVGHKQSRSPAHGSGDTAGGHHGST